MNEYFHSCQCFLTQTVTLTMSKKADPEKAKSQNRIALSCSNSHGCVYQEKEGKVQAEKDLAMHSFSVIVFPL